MSIDLKQTVEPNIAAAVQSHERPRINVFGYHRSESGVGAATRGYVRALRSLDIDITLHELSELPVHGTGRRSTSCLEHNLLSDINVICVDKIEKHCPALSQIGATSFNEYYNIGVWWWELMRFPLNWQDRFAPYSEIWVGTSFIANALAPVSPVPVVRIPPVLSNDTIGSREAGRSRLNLSEHEFVYLFTFDVKSNHRRKNPLAVIERDSDRDRFMGAEEAVQYGLIDRVLTNRAEATV